MPDKPLIVVGGTFAVGPFAHIFYAEILRLRQRHHFVTLHDAGLGHTRLSCQDVLRDADELYPDERVDLCGHSQGGSVVAWLKGQYPDRFGRAALIATPARGVRLAPVHTPVGSAIRCLSLHSRFVEEELAGLLALSPHLLAEVVSVYASGDGLVPIDSSYINGAHNICIAPTQEHDKIRSLYPGISLVAGSENHLSIVRSSQGRRLANLALNSLPTDLAPVA